MKSIIASLGRLLSVGAIPVAASGLPLTTHRARDLPPLRSGKNMGRNTIKRAVFLVLAVVALIVGTSYDSPNAEAGDGVFGTPSSGYIGYQYTQSYSTGQLCNPNTPGDCHAGIDIWTTQSRSSPPPGNNVYSVYDGTIKAIWAKVEHWEPVLADDCRATIIMMEHHGVPGAPDPVYTQYLHMSRNDQCETYVNPNLVVGQFYPKGTYLGRQGNKQIGAEDDVLTHLHFQVSTSYTDSFYPSSRDPSPLLGFDVNYANYNDPGHLHWLDPFPPSGGTDTTPPTASWASPSNGQTITSSTVHLEANASDDSSGVNRVSFSAAWGGSWHSVATEYSAPYAYDWDWCNWDEYGSDVPNGDVELGLEAWDNAGNPYYYSQHYPNYHITKSYTCPSETHLECQNCQCVRVSGAGSDQCSPEGSSCCVPVNVEYFSDTNLGSRCATADESGTYIFKNWGESGPSGGCPSDNWSARFTRRVHFQSGLYTFGLGSDDWGRVKVGSDTVVNNWQGAGQHYESCSLSEGDYNVIVEFADTVGLARLTAFWWGPGFSIPREAQDSARWYAQYWPNQDSWWDSVARQNESGEFFSHDWYGNSPGWGLPEDHFSTRFEKTVNFACGRYRFHVFQDDGARVYIDGNLVPGLDHWQDGRSDYYADVDLTAGNHTIRVDHYENAGWAGIGLDWEKLSDCVQDAAEFVGQSEYPTVEAGQQFSIYFEVRNTGNTTWRDGDGYGLENVNGQPLGAWPRREIGTDVPPGATKRWDIPMTAPSTPGPYRTAWMLKHGDQTFGPYMFIDVTVVPNTTPPAPTLQSPGNGSAFDEGQGITLSWSATGNEYYGEVWGGPGGTLTFGWQSGTSKDIGPQWAGYTYSWHVKARNGAGESPWSATWTFTVKPAAPSNLSAQTASCSQINLNWTDNSGNEEGYRIYRNGSYLGQVGANAISYQDTGLGENTTYSYYVKAFRGSIESNPSNTASAATYACQAVTVDRVSVSHCTQTATSSLGGEGPGAVSQEEVLPASAAQETEVFRPGEKICMGIAGTNHTSNPISTYWSWGVYNSSGTKVPALSYDDWPWTMNPGLSGAGWGPTIPTDLSPGTYTFIGSIRWDSNTDSKSTTFTVVLGTAPPALSASYSSSPPTNWTANQSQSYSVVVTNTGSQTWNASGPNNVRLGIHFGTDNDGWGVGWATDQRFELPGDVAPGGSVTLPVTVTAPGVVGSYVLRHRMVKEGIAWFDQIQKTNVTVVPALSASYSSSPPTSWTANQSQSYSVVVTNTGLQTWNASGPNNVRLGIHFGTDNDGWGVGWATDQRFELPGDVAPGGSVTLPVTVTAPGAAGSYVLRHRMVKEGIAWFDQIQKTNVSVIYVALSASYSVSPPTSWAVNQSQSYSVVVTNTGSQTWNASGPNNVRLGIHFGSDNDGWGVGWATDQRFELPGDVAPGVSVTLPVTVTAPGVAGSYVLRHRMVKEGVAWFDQIQKTNVTVY